jgi:hypothetical protein
LKILFDHNVDRRFRRHLPGHEIKTTREMRWETLTNGLLLAAAANANFEAFLSIDKKLEHEQNLQTLPLPIIVIDSISNALPALVPFAPSVLELLKSPLDRLLYLIEPNGSVLGLASPRP